MPSGRITDAILNEPIGLHVKPDYTALRPDWSVQQSLEHLRLHPPAGRVIYIYVTSPEGKLLGVVPTRRLLLNPPDRTIADIMVKSVVAVPAEATVLEALEFFSLHRLLAIPVVDAQRALVGVVDVDLYTDELAQAPDDDRVHDDVFQMIGVHLQRGAQQHPLQAFRGRFPWLICNVLGGLLAAVISGVFNDVLNWRHAVLALFVPLVLTLAESVSIQSVTLTLQSFRTDRLSLKSLYKSIIAEATTGIMLGVGTAFLVGVVAIAWQRDVRVAAIVFLGISGGVTLAAMVGVAVPSVLRLLKRDPQVAAGPVCLAAADAFALLFYFNSANLIGLAD